MSEQRTCWYQKCCTFQSSQNLTLFSFCMQIFSIYRILISVYRSDISVDTSDISVYRSTCTMCWNYCNSENTLLSQQHYWQGHYCDALIVWCIVTSPVLHHLGVQLILAYSWARPAILVVGKGRGGMFLFLLFLHFHSCSSFFPVPLFHLLYSLFYLFSPFLWETTQNDPQGLTCR